MSSHRTLAFAVSLALASGAAFAGQANHPAAGRALGLLDAHGTAVQRNAADRFSIKDVVVDANGTEHVRRERTYRGLRVIGGDVVEHSRNGAFKSASLTLKSAARPARRWWFTPAAPLPPSPGRCPCRAQTATATTAT